MAFVATNKAPGVYIDEIDVPGPIPGVGTSTAALIGPARRGPINKPTFLTNWTQFVEAFGVQDPFGPYIISPPVYAAHAVRGFFDNGGATCYFVRVGNAEHAKAVLKDGAGKDLLVVTAKEEGTAGDAITVDVQQASTKAVSALGKLTAPSAADSVTVTVNNADAAQFKQGDIVLLKGTTEELAKIKKLETPGATDTTITFFDPLKKPYKKDDAIRIADLTGQDTIRVADTTGFDPGTNINVSQAAGLNTTTESAIVDSVDESNKFIKLKQKLTKNFSMASGAAVVNVKQLGFSLKITNPNPGPNSGTENFGNLSMDPRDSRYFAKVVSSQNVDVALFDPSSTGPDNLPAVVTTKNLADGKDDNLSQIEVKDYSTAIETLERVDDVNILCIPDTTDQAVQKKMIEHCEKMQDRFAILDPENSATLDRIGKQLRGDGPQDPGLPSLKGYAALYYPRIVISNPVAAGRLKVPPSGHIAGVYARTDNNRGVHKAPANEALRGALGLEQTLTDGEQGPLNEKGVNVLRVFPGRGVTVWGARTIAPPDVTAWRYINVRRLLLFIEESIQEGTAFAVFEPNNLELWQKVKRQVNEFLTRVWRDGALFGATADKAFRVRIDEELNPPAVRALGQLVIEVIVFPVTPAEFIVFRVIQKPGGGSFDEL